VGNAENAKALETLGRLKQNLQDLGFGMRSNVVDPNDQTRQLILFSLPVPPLPVMAVRDGEDGARDTFISSHELIAVGMEQFSERVRSSSSFAKQYDDEIMQAQLQYHRNYTQQLDDLWKIRDSLTSDEILDGAYNVMKDYTRLRIAGYLPWLPPEQLPDVRFMDMDHVTKGSSIHLRTAEYISANRLLVGTRLQNVHKLKDFCTYDELIRKHFEMYCLDGEDEANGEAPPGIVLDVAGGIELLSVADDDNEAGSPAVLQQQTSYVEELD
jgi:hypothetical protein